MTLDDDDVTRLAGRLSARFPTTSWSLILAAAQAEGNGAREALGTLCERYWYPIYVYCRRHAPSREEAEDLTQGFFLHILDGHLLQAANPDRGRFRSFLLTCLRHHLSHARARDTALKRGGGVAPLPLDWGEAESRYHLEAVDSTTPERLFERRWALDLLARTLMRLRDELTFEGKDLLFGKIEPYLTRDESANGQSEIAAELGMTVNALRVAIHRLRRRFVDMLRDEVGGTVIGPEEVDAEIEHLCCVFGSTS